MFIFYIGYKSEIKPKKRYWFSPHSSDSREEASTKRMLMSRVEWMLQIQEIFHKLVIEFDENIFHKNLIIQRIKESKEVFPLMEEELYDMAHLDKGYSLNQVTKAIASCEKTYLRYDDVIEKISVIGKDRSLLEDVSLIPASARNLTSIIIFIIIRLTIAR